MTTDFEYNGKLASDMGVVITGVNIGQDTTFGMDREILKGEKTKYRPRSNHFGTLYSGDLEFDITLMKSSFCDGTAQSDFRFTSDDIRRINAWLTSPQFPKLLKLYNEEYYKERIEYFALFESIEAEYDGYVYELVYHVICDSPFGYTPEITHEISPTVTMPVTLTVTNNSDEYEEYVYPRFEIHPTITGKITIENVTDGNSMTFEAQKDNDVIWDCQKMQFKDTTGKLLSFEDMGVTDVDKIYWFRLCYGENKIKVSGGADIKLIYREPRKVGAF